MECNNCTVDELLFTFRVKGTVNLAMMPEVMQHLKRRNMWVDMLGNDFKLKESEVSDFVDFCKDHMNPNDVTFIVPNQEWKPFREIENVLDMQWIDEIIKNEQLICYYQPIVDAKGDTFAYEILSRFQNIDGTLIYPNEIFSAARERGRLYALDRVCRMTAVKYAARLKDKKAFINFIPTSIYSPEFCLKSTTNLANELGVDPAQLVFEVVESEQVEDRDHLKRILNYYKEKGFQYALDDVGEGYNTLDMLEDIKPKYMKLDMKYVQGVASDNSKQEIALKSLEKALQVESVPLAEGIEEKEDFEWLKAIGYQLFQGYYFGKPAPTPI
ncbi:EAL domain-containing protein [Psychrobacillus glaciei]|uniref:EAL domain-containing protein n=1 Tax=Psychrobacillus glaciei TaxID=2283160 RepID=A0A5J6SU09_9BACI|nr:EAL domain-containing protein [Psychrobacillus glaciei]QFG00973.1 EAL domain-containing protein [Psychrobacillus glaciei]